MGLPWKIITENIINISQTIQDLLDTTEKKDVTWIIKDKLGNVAEKVLPNIAKIKAELSEVTVKAMSQAEYEYIRETRRKEFAGSGQVDEEGDFSDFLRDDKYGHDTFLHTRSYPSNRYLRNSLAFPLHEKIFATRSYNPKFHVDGHIIKLYGTGGMYENLSGDDTWNGNTFGIKLPEGVSVDKTVINLRSIETDINHGDVVLVKASDTNLFKDPDFEEEIGVNWAPMGNSVLEISEGSIIVKNADMYHGFYQTVCLVPGFKYRIEIDVDFMGSDNYEAYVWLGSTGRNGDFFVRPISTENSTGKAIVEFVATNYIEIIQFQVHTLDPNKPLSDVKFNNPKLYILEDALMINNGGDLSAGRDVCDADTKVTGTMRSMFGNARKDLVILESWTEEIDAKDIVYPLGNVQWYGKDILGTGKLVQPNWFEGYDRYSLFGAWQESGELIGYGYRWSELTDEEKNKLISDPENNIFKDENGILKQVRYRVRVVKGVSNFFKKTDPLITGDAYSGPLSVFGDQYYHVRPQGEKTSLEDDIIYWTGDSFFPSAGVYLLPFYPGSFKNRPLTIDAIPLFLVQRRNNGIYHPIHNPNGTASYVEDGSLLSLGEYIDKITRLADCFNPVNIAYYKPETGEVISETDYKDLDDKTGWFRTGETESTILRPDNMPIDGIAEADVVDLRRDGRNRDYAEILEKTLFLHSNGKVNGYEAHCDYIKIRLDLDETRTMMRIGYRTTKLMNYRSNDMFPMTGSNYNKPVHFYDVNGDYIGSGTLHYASLSNGVVASLNLKEPVPDNAFYARVPVPNYTDATGYNKSVTTALVLSNLTSYKNTYDYEAVSGVSQIVDIKINDLVKVGSEYYMSKTTRNGVDLDPDKESYSNDVNWYKVNDDEAEVFLTENELKSNIEVYTLRKLTSYVTSARYDISLPQSMRYGYDKVHKVLLKTPDGRVIEVKDSDDGEHLWFTYSTSSMLYIYNLEREIEYPRDFMVKGQIIVIYRRIADPMTILAEGTIKKVNDVVYSSSTVYDHHFGSFSRMLLNTKLDGSKYGLGSSVKRNQTGPEILNAWPGYWLEHENFDESYGRPSHAVKFLPYVTADYDVLYQSYLYREQLNENITPDINRLRYNGSYTYMDYNANNDKIVYGVKRVKLPYFRKKSGV